MSEIGKEIRRMREGKGWSQAELAVYAGSSQPTVNQIESGKRNPSTATLVKLAKALDIEVADLFPKAQAPLPLSDFAEQRQGANEMPENVWRTEYLTRANNMLDKWEDEFEAKAALAENDPAQFHAWVKEVREFGGPHMEGLFSAVTATSRFKLLAIRDLGLFAQPWWGLLERIAQVERDIEGQGKVSEEDQRVFWEWYEEEKSRNTTVLEGKD